MTVEEFINHWNACCLHENCRITVAALHAHNINQPWGNQVINHIHLYRTTANAAVDNPGIRNVTKDVDDFFVQGQTIQIAQNNADVTSVYKNPPNGNPTCFTPGLMVYVS